MTVTRLTPRQPDESDEDYAARVDAYREAVEQVEQRNQAAHDALNKHLRKDPKRRKDRQ